MTATTKPSVFDPELRRLCLVVIAGAIMTILDTTIVNVAITPLGRDFHTSLSTIQWVLTGYTLALSMTIPITGWAIERFGAKTTWIGSLLIFITGSILCGVAWNVPSLIVFRVLQGVGGGMILPVGQTMLARKAGPDRMAKVMAVIAVPAMLGPVLGPVLGGLIIDDLSWRWMFYVNVPLCALALLLAWRMLPRDTERTRARLDGIGLALLSPGLALMVYGLSSAGSDNTRMFLWLAVGATLVAAFAVYALRTSRVPLVTVRAFARRPFAAASLAMFVYTGAMFGFMVVLPVYYQVVRGESPLKAGLLLAPLGLGAIVTMALSGRLSDRIQPRWIVVPGMAIVVVAAVVFSQLHVDTALLVIAGALFVAGLGHGTILPPAMGASYQGVPREDIPSVTAAFNVILRVGSSFGTAALAVVLQQAIRTRVPGANSLAQASRLRGTAAHTLLTSAFGATFWWIAGIAALAIVPALFIPRRPATPPPTGPTATSDSAAEPLADQAR